MRNRDQRLSQHLIVGVLVNVSGKVAIDLYQIKEEILKMAKRRHSRPEIVQCKCETMGLHFFHETNYDFGQLHRAVFADLKNQPIRMKRRTGQFTVQHPSPSSITKGARRDVDGQAGSRVLLQKPKRQLKARCVNVTSKAGFLNFTHELRGGYDAPRFIHHADQTFIKRHRIP